MSQKLKLIGNVSAKTEEWGRKIYNFFETENTAYLIFFSCRNFPIQQSISCRDLMI